MKKVLIQVVSVITLVFGTCYQSVLALADDRSRTELSGVQLNDSEGNKTQQVKVSETNELEMTVTVNNKDDENKDGEAAMWLPEDQLKVIKNRVKAESAVTDTNATLIFERKNKQQKLAWKNVETTATFKLKLPVQFKTPMTNMALPIALGTQREYLDPMTVLSKDATEKEVQNAGKATQLPANLLQSLTSFIEAQKAQEAQQAEAPAKDDNEDQDTVKEDVAKEETEAKRDAEKKAEQEAADKEKQAAKTRDALKKNGKAVTAESKSDGAEREGEDGTGEPEKEGTDLGKMLQNAPGNDALDKSLFNTATLKTGDVEIDLTDGNANVTDLKDFELRYTWDSPTLLEKLGNYQIQENDYYTFKIYGSSLRDGGPAGGDLMTPDNVEYARWSLEPKTDKDGKGYQEVTITFTNEMVNKTTVLFDMEIKQTYTGSDPIVIEFNEEESITVDPIVTEKLLDKDGVFIGNNQIRWTVDLDTSGKVNGRTMQFSDIKLVDTLLLGGNNQNHAFADMQSWTAKAADGSDLTNNFRFLDEKEPGTVAGVTSNDVKTDKITFTFITEYDDGAVGQFGNKVGGSIGDGINLDEASAHVSTSELKKEYQGYDKESKRYSWNVDVLLNLDQFSTIEEKRAALRSLTLTDNLTGPHVFKKAQLDLHVTVPTSKADLAEYFIDSLPAVDDPLAETKELVLKFKADISNAELDTLIGLLEKDAENKSGQTLSIAYKTVESGKGGLDQVKNSMKLEWDGGLHDSGNGPGSQKGDLIVKSGDLQRDEIYEDGLAHVKWQIEVNKEERTFDTLKVVDVLPNGVAFKDIKSIKVGNKIVDMTKFENGVFTDGNLKITQGYATPTDPKDEKLYDFSKTEGDRTNQALLFEFNNTFKGKINIEMETTHEWEKGSPKNYVGALINDSLHEYADGTATIPDRVKANAFKDGKLQLKDQDLESKNNAVQWSIGIGSRLNTYFGTGTNHVNKVKVDDIINGKDGDEAKYLSFLEDTSNYKLYSVSKDAYEKDKGSKELIPTTGDDAEATIAFNGDVSGDKAEITIEFNEKAKDNQYSFLILEFETPFDLKAWEEFNKDKDSVILPKVHTFLNDATVSYDYKDQEIKMDVSAHAELNAKEMYGSKTAKKMDNNQIQWEAILNGTGLNIGKPVITDTLKGNHLHDLDNNAIEISLVDVVYEQVTYPDGTTGRKAVVVNPDDAEKLTLDEDYKIQRDGQKMTITFNEDGPDITRPILLRYKTTVVSPDGEFSNKVSISGKGYTGEYTKDYEITGGAFAKAWGTRFLKVDGDDKDKKLSGAKFKLQWSKPGANDWSDATDVHGNPIPELISDDQGFIQFNMLGDIWEYRLIETETPEGYENSQLTELLFSYEDYKEDNWAENTPTIENRTTMPANLMISKKVEKLDNVNNFNFEVRSVDEKGKLDTYLNGQYTLYRDGKPEGSVTFTNGISEGIKLDAGETVTIKGLPVKKVDEKGNKIDRHYDVRETSDSPDYTTSVQVDNGTVTRGKQTKPFTLDESGARDVGVYFKNTAAKGDLIVNKTVSSETEDELDKRYNFTIETDQVDKVKEKTYKNEGTRPSELTFNDAGKTDFSLRNGEQLRLVGLPEGVEFTVTEEKTGMTTTWSINGEDYTEGNSGSVVINSSSPQNIDVKNSTTKSGQLEITKGIAGNIKADEEFKFEINTNSDNDGTYPAMKYTVSNGQPGLPEKVKITNGTATLTLKGDQGVRISNLPLDQKFTVEEKLSKDSDPNIVTSWETATAEGNIDDIATITLRDPDKIESVKYTNALPNGSLELNKRVLNQLPGDQTTEFEFTIRDVEGSQGKVKDQTYTVKSNIPGLNKLRFNDEGQATVHLSDRDNVEVMGLPAGISLQVSEKKHPDFNVSYNIDKEGEKEEADTGDIKILDDEKIAVNYTNTRPDNGNLMLEKQAKGSYPTDKTVNFTIRALELDDGKNADEIDGQFSAIHRHKDGTTTDIKVKFTDGKAPVSIKPGEKLEVKNLPTGKYRVIEREDDSVTTTWKVGNKTGVSKTSGKITVDKDATAHVLFTNKIAVGSLELNKKVLNPLPGDQDTEFTFTIQAADDDIGKVAGETYDVETNFNGRDNLKFNTKGQATLKLSHNQSVKVLGLPTDVQLKIAEEQHSDFNVSYTINGDEDDDEDGPAVTIPDGKNVAVNYTNARPIYGSLMLQKRAEGSYPTDKGIKFTIEALGENQDLDRKFDATLTHTNETTTSQKVSFENGEAEVTILPGEKLLVQNLPTGQYQVAEERQSRLVTTTWDIGKTQGNREKAAPVTVEESDTAHVRFTNKIATGKLELNKSVASHDDADKDKDYKFEIRASRSTRWMVANKSYDVSEHSETKRIEFDRDGQSAISLKDGQTITVSDLPEGVRLAVIETDSNDLKATWNVNSEGSYEELSQRNRPNITITEDQTEVVSYRNVRDPVGSLRVDKIVKGAYTDDHRKFEFTVDAQKIADKDSNSEETEDADDTVEWITNEEFNGKYNVKVYSRSNNELQENSQMKFTNGQATLELKADQYAVIEGLPLNDDEQFQVSETDPDIANMTTTWVKDNGSPETGLVAKPVTLDETDVPRITFTNNLETGDVVLGKKLTGEITDADKNQSFEFTLDVQVEDADNLGEWKTDETFAGVYTAIKTDADGRQTTSNVTFVDGQLKVHLKGNERLQISNLPTDTRMVISESVDSNYETSHQIDNNSVVSGITTDQMTIGNGQMHTVTFINNRPVTPQTAWLGLTKSVLGETGERDRGFEFNIRFLDDQMNPLTGTVQYTKTSLISGLETGQVMLEADGSNTFTLMDGETIRWNVPNGTHYQITESDYSADGYQTSISQGQAPEREGLTATGVVMTNDPGSAKVVYYNRAVTPPEEEPHTPEEPDTTVPGFVPPASESGTGVGTSTDGSMAGSGGSTAPQAHTSGTSGSGTAAKGFLPQTGEWMKQNWLLLLGLVILLSTIGLMIRAKRKKS